MGIVSEELVAESGYNLSRRGILTPFGAIVPTAGKPDQKHTDGTNFPYYTLDFDKGSDEAAYWEFLVPDDYDGGVIAIFIWYKTTVESGNVIFAVQVLGRQEDEIFDSALGDAQPVTDTVPGTAGKIGVCAHAPFDPGWSAGDLVVIKLFRDADNESDTADADVSVLMLELEY